MGLHPIVLIVYTVAVFELGYFLGVWGERKDKGL